MANQGSKDTKTLLQNDLEIQRYYMDEALAFYGISARYYQLKPGAKWTVAGELKANYFDPIKSKVIFDQVPKVSTLKKLGWVTELNSDVQPLIHVSFDTPGIQVGCLYEIKDPLTPDNGRMFRVTKMTTGIVYPASVTCQIVPIVGTDIEATTDPYDGKKWIRLDKEEQEDVY